MTDLRQVLALNMKFYRKKLGITQAKLAEKADITENYIAMVETEKRFPSVNMIERIAAALKIESWRLFKNEPVSLSGSSAAKRLAPTQKNEIIKMTNAALSKILDNF